jgi:hypothetical protein
MTLKVYDLTLRSELFDSTFRIPNSSPSDLHRPPGPIFSPSIFPASNLYPQFFIHEAPPPSVSGPFIQNSMFILSALNPQATEGSPFSPSYLPMFLPFPASNLHLPEASKTNYKQKHIDNVYTIIYH